MGARLKYTLDLAPGYNEASIHHAHPDETEHEYIICYKKDHGFVTRHRYG